MKELNKKVFRTIFLILSLFIVLVIVVYNINIYSKEYNGVHRHLTFMDRDRFKPDDKGMEPKDRNIDNMMIMDYEVYTVIISNNEIDRIISHNDSDSDFDIDKVSKFIISKDKGLKIGNLYISKYSYNYTNDRLVIINNQGINSKLLVTLVESIILLLGVEIIIYYVSRMLTKRIIKPAEEAFSKQKDFIADASHELKTPLAVIMASADEIKCEKKNSKYIDNIKYESERMNNLIKSLLDLSKLENGVSIDSYKNENISKIIEKVCLIFEGVAFEENIKIDTNIDEDIILKCNKDEIERLISIVLDNAIKHSYNDSTIKVNVNKDKNNINIEIINKGEPIKSGDEDKIFERFYRSDKSRNRDANRYGLGLAIAKNIVINHNGSIKAYSKDGKTTFKINFKK